MPSASLLILHLHRRKRERNEQLTETARQLPDPRNRRQVKQKTEEILRFLDFFNIWRASLKNCFLEIRPDLVTDPMFTLQDFFTFYLSDGMVVVEFFFF